MKTWSFYDPATGLFAPRSLTGSDEVARLNTPTGLVAIEGRYDHLSQRVDLQAKQVVDYQPPAPDDDHEWNAKNRRWVKRPEVRERDAERARIIAEIEALEARQARPLRELAVDPQSEDARRRVITLDEQIAVLRAQLPK